MDTQAIVSIILLSVVLFLIILTFLFFIEHKKEKDKVIKRNYQSLTEGRYLKRFVPQNLKARYLLLDEENAKKSTRSLSTAVWYTFMVLASIILIIVFILVAKVVFTESLSGLFNA